MKKTAQMGLVLAFALILGYVESLIPFFFGIPGMKLGLANFAIVFTLYQYGEKEAVTINIVRIILSAFLFGNMYTLLYSLAGGIVSMLMMLFMKRLACFSEITVSMGGGVFHNVGQIIVAYFVVKTIGLFYYLPFLLIAGLVTGFLIGLIEVPARRRIMIYLEDA